MDLTHRFISRRKVVLAALLGATVAATASAPDNKADLFGVEIRGSGPDVLLLPGLASGPDVWSALAGPLSAQHRVHLIDIAGFAGRAPIADATPLASSLAEALAAYIARNGLSKPAVVGHSLGGEVGLMLAARHPASVGRLVIVDALPFYSLLFSPAATVETATPGARALRDAWLAATDQQLDAMHEAGAARLATSAESRAAIARWGRASDRRTVAQAAYELAITDLRPELPKITAPTTVVYAHHPSYGPVEQVDGLFSAAYKGLGDARLVRIDESRHFVMLDQAAVFNEAVAKALR